MAYKVDKYDINIDIQLDNGVYIFTNFSSTGKTRLARLLHKYSSYGEPVFSVDDGVACDIQNGSMRFKNNKKVYMFDRYDLYNGAFADKIEELGKNAIVLVDCKLRPNFNFRTKSCVIILKNEHTVVVR